MPSVDVGGGSAAAEGASASGSGLTFVTVDEDAAGDGNDDDDDKDRLFIAAVGAIKLEEVVLLRVDDSGSAVAAAVSYSSVGDAVVV